MNRAERKKSANEVDTPVDLLLTRPFREGAMGGKRPFAAASTNNRFPAQSGLARRPRQQDEHANCVG